MTSDLLKPKMAAGKKTALWAVGILATAIAGFASERTQEQLCLKFPTYDTMKYPAEAAGSVRYTSLASKATKDEFDGKPVSFRAVYLGESPLQAYSVVIAAEQLKGKVALNTRDINETETTPGPFGGSSAELPKFAILVPYELATRLKDVRKGNVIEFDGVAFSVKPGGKFAAYKAAVMPPDFASFVVQAQSAAVIRPLNHPADRALCRLLHADKVSSF